MEIKNIWIYKVVRRTYYSIKNRHEIIDNFKIARKLKKYKNRHKNESCVIVGNGPSLTVEDLSKLHELGVPTFACNRIHMIFDQTNWRPTYYFMSDEKLIAQYEDDVPDVPKERRFFPKKYRETIKNGIFYNELPFAYEQEGKFSLDASEGIYAGGSVTTEMIQFAYYMGFAKIYLIGVDFSYAVNSPINNRTYTYQGEDNYFIKGYLKPGEVADMPNITANLLSFHAAKEAIEGHGREIYNATRGGKLEVFVRKDLDKVYEEL